jgi:hypothetical protein
MNSVPITKTIAMRETGYDEIWLQDQIWENPSCLQLGDLEGITKEKIVSSGGKLDLLFKNPLDDSMYEVEVTLGETDPSHIIRTIEYWDLVKKRWPQRQHFAVLVAERITKRFFNVINILSGNIPLVAIQANIIEVDGKRSLHFTKILDVYEEPEEDITAGNEVFDKKYWEKKSVVVLRIAEKLLELTNDIYKAANLVLNKGSISISCEGYNQMTVYRRTGEKALIVFRFGNKKEEIIELLDSSNISYTEGNKHIKMTMDIEEIASHDAAIKKISELNYRWWQ